MQNFINEICIAYLKKKPLVCVKHVQLKWYRTVTEMSSLAVRFGQKYVEIYTIPFSAILFIG
jgi:hypothetical protein